MTAVTITGHLCPVCVCFLRAETYFWTHTLTPVCFARECLVRRGLFQLRSGGNYRISYSVICRGLELIWKLLTPWCRVLLEKLTGFKLVKKFPAFHGIRRFITALTNVRHLSLSWASLIQSIYPHLTSWRFILILSTHLRLGLLSGVFSSGFPTKNLYTPLSPPIRATYPTHLILLDFITRTILDE